MPWWLPPCIAESVPPTVKEGAMKNPAYTTINFVGPADLRRDLHDAAEAEDRSVSSILRAICRRYLDERRTAGGDGKAA